MSDYKKKLCLKYLFYIFAIIILFYANIQKIPSPFFYAIILSAIYFRVNLLFVCFMYILVINLNMFTLNALVSSILIVMEFVFIVVLHKFIKKPISKFLILVYYLITQILLYYNNFSLENLLSAVLGLILLICFINYLKAFNKKTNIIHFTVDQYICGAVILIGIGLGLNQLPYFSNEIFKFVGTLLVLIFTFAYNGPTSVSIGVLLGLGGCFNGDIKYLFYFSVIALFCYGFKGYNVFISGISILVAELILGLYFNIYGYYEWLYILPTLSAIIIFLIFNKRLIEFSKNIFGTNITTYGIKTLVNRNREQICYKMNELSQVFNEMHRLYVSMINGKPESEEITRLLINSLTKNLCDNCNKKEKCFSEKESQNVIEELKLLFKKGITKGKISILDVSPQLSFMCDKLSKLIAISNNLIVGFKQYRQMIKTSDTSKLLIAEQLKGVASLLDMLNMEIGTTVLFNAKLEQKLREELSYYDVICEEVLCYEINEDFSVSIVINNISIIDTDKVEQIISKVLKKSFTLTMEQMGYYGNFYEFRPSPKFGYIFGASGKGKEKVSGDTFSFTKINKDRIMFAICDGMGTGENAQNISETSINMIENFYKAGYDSQIILSSVNKLLTASNEEQYSALDIIVLDLSKGYANFIKLGAPDGLIKTENGIERIKSGALPLGILEEVEPMILERDLNSNDILCMFSDGIVDAFGSMESLIEFIDGGTTTNPQTLADNILNQSLIYNKNVDDKTVICIRLFFNY